MAKQNLENVFARRPAQASYKRRCQNRETTHYLFCPFMTLYALWYPRMKRSERAQGAKRGKRDTRVTRVRKGHKGQRDKAKSGITKLSATTHYLFCPFMTLYALWCPTTKRAERAKRGTRDRETQTHIHKNKTDDSRHPFCIVV